uniref:Nucleoside diphosphate kinase B n=1 Tax=Oncorhynchus tshawytscha TaxID=74940 RepID=A0A8C8FQJ9_ONCTS
MFFPSQTAFMSSEFIALSNCTKAGETPRNGQSEGRATCACHLSPSLLAKYGTSDLRNAMHGSISFSVEREIKFMFPKSVIEPIPMGEASKDYLGRFVRPTLLRGFTELCKQKPVAPCTWLADWLVRNNPNKPQIFDGVTGEEAA